MALLLGRKTIEGLLDMTETMQLMEDAFVELSQGTTVMPQRLTISDSASKAVVAFMPAYLRGMGALGIKTLSRFVDNPSKHNLPSVMSLVLLLDSKSGKPLAVMDGNCITEVRTGAISAVATKYLARPDAKIVGVLGTGVQARTQLWGVCEARKIKKAICYSKDDKSVQGNFAKDMTTKLQIDVELTDDSRKLVEMADVLILATRATQPIIDGDWLKEGAHINAMGSHAPNIRELDSKTIVRSKIVCDSISACLAEAGDLLIPIAEGVFSPDRIYGDLAEVIMKKKGRQNDDEITLFKSVGLAIEDVSSALLVYNKAVQQKVGEKFEF